jgi:hypothetical protein
MSRYIDADLLLAQCRRNPLFEKTEEDKGMIYIERSIIDATPTANVVEVRHDFNVGDFCLYGFADGNNSLAIVEIVKILDDERGIAELKFHKVIKDNTGNGFFHYLLKSGGTMNGSFKYLKNITPKADGERREE